MLTFDELGRRRADLASGRAASRRASTSPVRTSATSCRPSRCPKGASVAGLGKSDTRGVLVISLVADQDETTEATPVAVADVVGLISLRVPDKSIQSKRELIQYGVVISGQGGRGRGRRRRSEGGLTEA